MIGVMFRVFGGFKFYTGCAFLQFQGRNDEDLRVRHSVCVCKVCTRRQTHAEILKFVGDAAAVAPRGSRVG